MKESKKKTAERKKTNPILNSEFTIKHEIRGNLKKNTIRIKFNKINF